MVVGGDGTLIVGAEYERHTNRSADVGQVVALAPAAPEPRQWGVVDVGPDTAGVWATPALHRDLVIAPTDTGRLLGIDRATGVVRWEKFLPGPLWSSPVIVDDVLIQGDCAGFLHGFDVSQTQTLPNELWSVELGGCIESTPAVWDGGIYVGTRAGLFHALRLTASSADEVAQPVEDADATTEAAARPACARRGGGRGQLVGRPPRRRGSRRDGRGRGLRGR